MLAIGDKLTFDGFSGICRAVVSTTDANGRGSIAYGGATFQFRVLRCPQVDGTDYPLTATSDPRFRAGVIQRDDNPLLFVLAVDDGPAPDGAGMFVQGAGGVWAEAQYYVNQDSVLFITGYWLKVVVKKGGVLQVGAQPDFELLYQTADGGCRAYYPPMPHDTAWDGQPTGMWLTDAAGLVKRVLPNGSTEHVIVGRGVGALGHRSADTWVSGPVSERLLSSVKAWYLQESMECVPNGSVVLDVAGCSLQITGPNDGTASYYVFWEDGPEVASGTLTGGDQTLTGLPLGKYAVTVYCSDQLKGLARQYVTCSASGATYTAAFGATWTEVAGASVAGVVYAYGATPAPGVTVWMIYTSGVNPPYLKKAVAVTDDGGAFSYTPTEGEIPFQFYVDDATYGGNVQSSYVSRWWDPVLGARVAETAARNTGGNPGETPPLDMGFFLWGEAGAHQNLPPPAFSGYVQNEDSGQIYQLGASSQGNGLMTDPLPRCHVVLTEDPIDGWTAAETDSIRYGVHDAGGTLIETQDPPTPDHTFGLPTHETPPGLTADRGTHSPDIKATFGGKVSGNLVEYAPSQRITTADLTEAARQGLESGAWSQPLEARAISATVDAASGGRYLTFQSWSCPYCDAACWDRPNTATYKRGYCPICALNGYTVDLRTYFVTPTLAALEDWFLTIARNRSAGGHVKKRVPGWPRPEEYAETDAYLATIGGLLRWKAVHIVLGTLVGSVFTDGESIADAETRLGRTVGPVQLKLVLTHRYSGTGKWVKVVGWRADGKTEILSGEVRNGLEVGDLIFLKSAPHDDYKAGTVWFIDVLNAWDGDRGGSGWTPSRDYEVGRIDNYEGVYCGGRCTDFVVRFWNEVLGITDTAAFKAAMESQNFPFDPALIPSGCTQVVSGDYDAAPVGSILYLDTTLSPETLAHVGIIHRYGAGVTKLANSNHVPPPGGDNLGYMNNITDFTGLAVFGWIEPPAPTPGSGYLACQIVNDGPAWHSSAGVTVTHQAYSPYACDISFGGRWPFLLTEPTGLMLLTFIRDGGVFLAEKQFGQQFGTPKSVSAAAGYNGACERPVVARLYTGGGLLVSADDGSATRLWLSKTNGDSWQPLTVLPLRYCEIKATAEGLLHLVGLSGGNLAYSYSDDNGFTWTEPVTVAAVDATRPPTITLQGGRVFLQAFVGGFTRTWRTKTGGDSWEFVGTVGG